MRTSCASSCSALSTGIAAMVVQFGLAMMPFGRLPASRAKLTSLTTSGTSGSLRHADELSITVSARGGEPRRLHPRHRRAGGEQRDVQPGRVGGLGVLDLDLLAAERQLLALRASRGEEPHRRRREVALFEQRAHHLADLPGRADHTNVDHLRPVPAYTTASSSPPRPNASCSAATALSSSVSLTSTEIRISEVEIRSMFTPTPASASQNVAVTPGWLRMPAPTSDTLPMWSS